ncbi:hypothetical protein D3C85_1705310 [compost metagenome]
MTLSNGCWTAYTANRISAPPSSTRQDVSHPLAYFEESPFFSNCWDTHEPPSTIGMLNAVNSMNIQPASVAS